MGGPRIWTHLGVSHAECGGKIQEEADSLLSDSCRVLAMTTRSTKQLLWRVVLWLVVSWRFISLQDPVHKHRGLADLNRQQAKTT